MAALLEPLRSWLGQFPLICSLGNSSLPSHVNLILISTYSAFLLPDGKVFIIANNRTIIYDIETDAETPLPDIPNGVRVTNPYDGTASLLPLSPPHYIPEVLVCGGTNASDALDVQLDSQDPASDQCSRITLTPEGIKKGWVLEKLLETRIMPEMILLPNGQVVIVNGAKTGYAALSSDIVSHPVAGGNADHPVCVSMFVALMLG
jgi:hypothetical protein